jgi:hypothetical protein
MHSSLWSKLPLLAVSLIALPAVVSGESTVGQSQAGRLPVVSPDSRVLEGYGNLPLAFEPNAGQAEPWRPVSGAHP